MGNILNALVGLVKEVTWQRVILTITLISTLLVVVLVYDSREELFQRLFISKHQREPNLRLDMGSGSREAMDAFMNRHPEVAILDLVSIDLKRNQRYVVLRNFNDNGLARDIAASEARGNKSPLPVFMTNEIENNNQMISLINGEYSCSDTRLDGLAKTFPTQTQGLKVSCRAPIPPAWSVGTVGYVVVHLYEEMDRTSMERLKLDLMTLSMFIYSTEQGIEGSGRV